MKLKWKKEYWILIGIILLILIFLKPQNILFSTTDPTPTTGNSTGLIIGILFVVVLPILLLSTGLGGGLMGVIAILILAALL